MDIFTNLLMPGNTSIAATLVLYSFVIAAGIYIGKMKIFGVSLGVTFVLFVGILMGHFGYIVDDAILKFVREFGLILFIFSSVWYPNSSAVFKIRSAVSLLTPLL